MKFKIPDNLFVNKLFVLLPVAGAIYYIDQLLKYFVNFCYLPSKAYQELEAFSVCGMRHWLEWLAAPKVMVIAPPGFSHEIFPFFNLIMVWNHGVTFGLFAQDSAWPLVIFSLIIVAVLLVWLFQKENNHPLIIFALSMVVGGALGNIADRIRYGAVVDYLDFHAFGWHYPAFNFADIAIVLGIAILLFDGLVLERKREQK